MSRSALAACGLAAILAFSFPLSAAAQNTQNFDLVWSSTGPQDPAIGFDLDSIYDWNWGAWPAQGEIGEFATLTATLSEGDSIPLPTYLDGSTASFSDVFWKAVPHRFVFSVPRPIDNVLVIPRLEVEFFGRTMHITTSCVAGNCGPLFTDVTNPKVDVFVFALRRSTLKVQNGSSGGIISRLSVVPNPSTRGSALVFEMSQDGAAGVRIFDTTGRLARDLGRMIVPRGPQRVEWDGAGEDGRRLAAGVYYFELEVSGARVRRRVVLLQ